MKILDRYILQSFLSTFATVFVILFFIFILQTVWLFIAELAGKDLDIFLVLKFLMFAMPRIIPLVLPLSVLLASIMTFGSFAENYEFAAMKSSGISLRRAMHSLVVFILLLSVASFFFANNVIPYAEYKFINFRADIAKRTPAMAIAEGQFSDIGTYNIKVDKKSGENGNHLTGVTIHKKAAIGNTTTVIKSKTGELSTSEKSNILQLILNDGNYYEDVTPKDYNDRKKLPFAKSDFKKYIINMDLSKLNKNDDESSADVSTNAMLNVSELSYTLDSLHKSYSKDVASFADNMYQRTGIVSIQQPMPGNLPAKTPGTLTRPIPPSRLPVAQKPADTTKKVPLQNNLLAMFTRPQKGPLLKVAKSNIESVAFTIDGSSFDRSEKIKNINNHQLAFYDKFVIAYACILMFFIGAPLGAIIRKGGIGLPIVFAVLIFITFHFINTFGKRISQSDEMPPFVGAWMSSFILTPFAILLTYRATNDIGLFSMDTITEPIIRFFSSIFKRKKDQLPES
ncbi:LptF/LptG family permease [Flavobacterium silvaticum]|uniref:YjgP/YjgQ family permease n=1 Tax=Flavobacterium silvaticum TaxID=1852020 RepID=A0A972FN40_9FLAO|nr:LptF/LptG family permease [Flavobacterium silvaticum]NMH28742.1 YjgP/YjgQ family permease [Flavobacterium silvaticum]